MRIARPTFSTENVVIGPHGLPAEWALPPQALGALVFCHSNGNRRQSALSHYVARMLQNNGLGTLLLDLLSPQEAMQRDNAFNIVLLAERVQDALLWLQMRTKMQPLPLGIFATDTSAAAALIAAARMPDLVRAIVSRGGRPDMASSYLADVRAPTLLIVGAKDPYVLNVNRFCAQSMTCVAELKIIPRATHLFEELGTLDAVTALASNWFRTQFRPPGDVPVEDILLRR